MSAVARRLGVAPSTLRTWALRYGLGPSAHEAGAHRRYSVQDVSRLELMRRLTMEGIAPAEAAAVARTAPRPERGPSWSRAGTGHSDRAGGSDRLILARVGAEEVARGLGRAALALDSGAVTGTIRRELSTYGVLATWEDVLAPALVAVGERWAATGEGVEVEHLLVECAGVALREVAEKGREPLGGRPVLLACVPAEQHSLPLYALAAALAEHGVRARILGPALPAEALAAAVRRTGPAVLFLWSQLSGTADPALLDHLPAMRPRTAIVLGGPGWRRELLPERAGIATGLLAALELVLPAAGRERGSTWPAGTVPE